MRTAGGGTLRNSGLQHDVITSISNLKLFDYERVSEISDGIGRSGGNDFITSLYGCPDPQVHHLYFPERLDQVFIIFFEVRFFFKFITFLFKFDILKVFRLDILKIVGNGLKAFHHDPEQVHFYPEPSDGYPDKADYRNFFTFFLFGHCNPPFRKHKPFDIRCLQPVLQPPFRFNAGGQGLIFRLPGQRRFQLLRHQNYRKFLCFIIKTYHLRYRYQGSPACQPWQFISHKATAGDCGRKLYTQQCHQERSFHSDKRDAYPAFVRPSFTAGGTERRSIR